MKSMAMELNGGAKIICPHCKKEASIYVEGICLDCLKEVATLSHIMVEAEQVIKSINLT
ncbi:hypothetical protein LCGC14_2945870 [marine sediment metagenome]|uniref:Uncharacterized protein n=1 Tax=marine sediment metagenome TaxID=412755 RepID=A0A0F8XGF5_9ZZZZ